DPHKSSTFEIGPAIDVGVFTAAQIITLDAGLSVTTITVTVEHSAFVIDCDFVKVEQVAVSILTAAALLPNTCVVLNGIVRRGVDRDPGPALVIGSSDIRIPHTGEIPILVSNAGTIGDIGAEKTASGAARAAAHSLGFGGVDDAVG